MNPPLLLAFDLQHEDVVYVVMSAEPLVLRGSDVRVGLHRMTELGSEPLTEFQDWWPRAMQRLQHQSRALGEEPDELVITYLIGDPSTNASGRSEGLVGKSGAALGDPDEWGA